MMSRAATNVCCWDVLGVFGVIVGVKSVRCIFDASHHLKD